MKTRYLVLALVLVMALSDAMAAGRGGEHIITGTWRAGHAALSPFTNPAFLVNADHAQLRYAGSRTLGEFALHELGLTLPLGLHQSLGMSWMYLGTGDYPHTDESGTAVGTITDRSNLWALTWAVNPWRRLQLGVNAGYARQHFASEHEGGFALDAGIAVPVISAPFLGRHTLGVAMQNLVAPAIGAGYARSLAVGWEGEIAERRVLPGAQLQLRGVGGDADWIVNTRLGLYLLRFFRLTALAGFKEEGIDYYGGIAGVNVPVANQGRDFSLMYQFLVPEDGRPAHSIYVALELGRHREELLARSIALRLNTAPSNLFDRARALFDAGRYWDAYLAFAELRMEYPDFFQMDWAEYYMARSLEELGMYEEAEKAFERVGESNVKSAVLPQAWLGLMRLQVRKKDHSMAGTMLTTLLNTPAPDSIRQHGFYLMGQSSMEVQRNREAMELFDKIPATHPAYPFAMYSASVAAVQQQNPVAARDYLLNVAATIPRDREHQEIFNRALVQLGYLVMETFQHEEQALSRAVAVLRRVPRTSIWYPDALVGLGWAAVRATNWSDAIAAGIELIRLRQGDPVVMAEGALIAGYSHVQRRDYTNAISALGEGIKLLGVLASGAAPRSGPSAELNQNYRSVAATFVELASIRQPLVGTRIDSLRREQTALKGEMDIAMKESFTHHRRALFSERIEALRHDIEFLHALALNLSTGAAQEKLRDRSQQRQQQLDDEIQRLEEQMRKLEE